MGARAAHFGAPDDRRQRAGRRAAALGGEIGIDERDHVAVIETGQRGAALGAVGDLDVAPLEPIADLR